MKRATILMMILAFATLVFAQQTPPSKTSQGGAQPATPSSTAQPNVAQPAPPQAPLQGKLPPQAKTQPEYDAYKAVRAEKDLAAFEKASDDFAVKYPDSDLRVLLYQGAMQAYQAANNGEKILEMGRKVLTLNPNQPEALIAVSEILVQRTRDTDLDKEQRWAEAEKDAQHALETIDTELIIPPGTPQDRIDTVKKALRSEAYSVIGALKFSAEKYADAETNFRKSVDAFPEQPDAVVVLRLALSLDRQGKYAEALQQANRAVTLADESTTAGKLARQERDRLTQLTGGGSTAPATKPAGTQNPAPPARTPNK